jgi:hypothetical protein
MLDTLFIILSQIVMAAIFIITEAQSYDVKKGAPVCLKNPGN